MPNSRQAYSLLNELESQLKNTYATLACGQLALSLWSAMTTDRLWEDDNIGMGRLCFCRPTQEDHF